MIVKASDAPERKLGPLAKGGTLTGEQAAGKDAGAAAKVAVVGAVPAVRMQIVDGFFKDDRWVNGRWDYSLFKLPGGKKNWDETDCDWDAVIDVEVARRKLLEDSPIPCRNEDMVLFDTAEIPWWAWVRRFHLPQAEKLNGRAAMMGYVIAGAVDLLSGAGLVDQQESFLGKVALHICVFGILLIRNTDDVQKYRGLLDEATNYDAQWQESWKGVQRPSETQEQ